MKITGGFTVQATFPVAAGDVLEPDPRRRFVHFPSATVDLFVIISGAKADTGFRIPANTMGLRLSDQDIGYDITQPIRGYAAGGAPVTVGIIVGRV